jgi:NodT family efflux transporter outer membrane factor (OMF) lipoprotein
MATTIHALSRRVRGAAHCGACLALLLAGCTVGPDFKRPDLSSTDHYLPPAESSPAAKTSVALGAKVTADWWTLFHAPVIDTLVKDAIAGSPTLDRAKAKLASAREAITEASAALYPQVNFNASVTRERRSATEFGSNSSAFPVPPNFNVFQLGPTASYDLDLFGGTRRQIEERVSEADFQEDQLDAAYVTLTGNTITEAIALADAIAELRAIDDTIDIDRQNLALVRSERLAGTRPDTDVVSAESQLAADETLQPAQAQALSAARHALADLLGRPPGDWAPPDFDLASLTLPGDLPVSLPSELVRQRPDILAAEAQLHAASARIGIATAQLYPSITLSGGASLAALDPGHLFNPASLVWSIAAGLAQPIFDAGLREAERQAALDDFKGAAADYRQTVLDAFRQVADILQALDHDAVLLAAQRHALDLATESVRLQRLSYAGGTTGILDLLDAQRQYQQARLGYVRAEAQRFRDAVQLLVAMGGGWWDVGIVVARNDRAPDPELPQ